MKSPERMRAKRYEIAALSSLDRWSARSSLTGCYVPGVRIGAVAMHSLDVLRGAPKPRLEQF